MTALKNNTVSTLKIGDKVRVYIKKQFDKGTEPQFSQEVYIIKYIRGKTYILDNDEKKKRTDLLLVPPDTIGSNNKNIIKQATKKYKDEQTLKRDGIDQSNIINEPRRRN